MKNLKILSEGILDKYKQTKNHIPTLAVVGNGGISPEDEERINDCDVIVAFNNYLTRENIRKRKHAAKCDILFSTLDLHSVGSDPRDVAICIPAPFHIKEIPKKMNQWYPKANHWMVNPYENAVFCEELGLNSLGYAHPLPSAGLTALYYLSKMPCKMFICGFQWYYSEETGLFQKHHLGNKNYPGHWNHSYPQELGWIIDNLYGRSGIQFSESCCRLLDIAKSQRIS